MTSFSPYLLFFATCITLLFPLTAVPNHTIQPPASPEETIRKYLAAKTRETALARLASDYRLFFDKKVGTGLSKTQVADMLDWDFALHPKHRIKEMKRYGRQVVVQTHEDNDFSLLIGFPGWDATSTFLVNEAGLISEQLYVPRPGQPEWKPYLEKALPWLRENRAEALARIYPDNRLKQTAESATEWVKVLREWRQATGQKDPTRP